ncbi:uncharacterized protein F5Z01DRAFT_29789 [Emericellopsis atlantica]|uniref:Altered inheritance of mitochondria protein 41 n=1 Tax=Emericellopsis atlantica TaxID=2614577 RepID=A0A9P7ZXQ2_9HYPO|nr:uncharacterized protein F5Z01DRAFT_29789 [Emericellopsis atlantica]KAG9259205.1 hypothetical protein F5Z01DRAFT_29789 [Emericellopsis atlantica]
MASRFSLQLLRRPAQHYTTRCRASPSIPCRFYATADSSAPTSAPFMATLKTELKTAMRNKDTLRLTVLRAIMSHNLNASKTKTPLRTDADLVLAIMRMRRAVEDARAEAKQVGREDLATKADEEVKMYEDIEKLSGVEVLGAPELEPIVRTQVDALYEPGAKTNVLVGKVMGKVKAATAGKIFEPQLLSSLVKKAIQEREEQ